MGSKYNWNFLGMWIEWTPRVYFRVHRKTREGYWLTVFERWKDT